MEKYKTQTLPEQDNPRKTKNTTMECAGQIHTHVCTTNARDHAYTKRKINQFAQKCLRKIIESTWYTKNKTHPGGKTCSIRTYKVYQRTEQPTVTSWMEKQSAIHMARQTQQHRKIHPQTMNRMRQIQENGNKPGNK